MPENLVGLVIFVALLTPGATYAFRREANSPVEGELSAVRETARLVSVSLLTDLVALGLLLLLRDFHVGAPAPARVLTDPAGLYRQRPLYVLFWAAAFLGVACLLAVLLATAVQSKWLTRIVGWHRLSWLFRRSITTCSAWWEAFNSQPDYRAWVQVELLDGSHLGGYVDAFSPDSDETADRELTLSGPVESRSAGSSVVEELDVNYVLVSARQIQYITVTYHDPKDVWTE